MFHVISQRDTAKWGHPKMLALRHFGICGVLRIFAGVLRKFAGVLLVISNVFGGSFHFAHLNPQTLKSTLDIQLPFQKQKKQGIFKSFRCLTSRTHGFFQDFESPGVFFVLVWGFEFEGLLQLRMPQRDAEVM